MLSHLERINLFLEDVPEDFLRDVVKALNTLHASTYDETSQFPIEYQRYVRPHLLRAQAEMAFLTAARRYELASDLRKNRSEDAHALAMTDRFTMTLSRTTAPNDAPRWARFRADYSRIANYRLPGPDFADEQPPIAIREDDPRLFVVITHGWKAGREWRDLGFVYANFLGLDGVSYTGPGINLIARLTSSALDRTVEEVREPDFDLKADEDSGEGAAR